MTPYAADPGRNRNACRVQLQTKRQMSEKSLLHAPKQRMVITGFHDHEKDVFRIAAKRIGAPGHRAEPLRELAERLVSDVQSEAPDNVAELGHFDRDQRVG